MLLELLKEVGAYIEYGEEVEDEHAEDQVKKINQ